MGKAHRPGAQEAEEKLLGRRSVLDPVEDPADFKNMDVLGSVVLVVPEIDQQAAEKRRPESGGMDGKRISERSAY